MLKPGDLRLDGHVSFSFLETSTSTDRKSGLFFVGFFQRFWKGFEGLELGSSSFKTSEVLLPELLPDLRRARALLGGREPGLSRGRGAGAE